MLITYGLGVPPPSVEPGAIFTSDEIRHTNVVNPASTTIAHTKRRITNSSMYDDSAF